MHRLITVVAVLALVEAAQGQNCSPQVSGAPGAPVDRTGYSNYTFALIPFNDETGTSLVAAGRFYFPRMGQGNTQYDAYPAAKYQRGRWSPMGAVTDSVGRSLALTELPVDGGPVQRSLYLARDGSNVQRWNGSSWTTTSVAASLITSFTDQQGPGLALVSSDRRMVSTWRGTGSAITTDPGTSQWWGSISSLRFLDDGSGPALYAAGDMSKLPQFRTLAKLVDGQWQQVPLPDIDPAAYATDVIVFDSGVGPELHTTIFTPATSTFSVYRRRANEWSVVGQPLPAGTGRLAVVREQGFDRLYHLAGHPYRWEGNSWVPPVYFTTDTSFSPDGETYAITSTDAGQGERTYVGGMFHGSSSAFFQQLPLGGYPISTPAATVISFTDGDAAALTSGLTCASQNPAPQLTAVNLPEGTRLIAHDGVLAAGGRFADNMAMFHNDQWTNLGSSYRASYGTMSLATGVVNGVTRLVRRTSAATDYRNDAGEWAPLPAANGNLASYNNDVYSIGANAVRRLDDATWTTVLTGLNINPTPRTITSPPNQSVLTFATNRTLYDFDGHQLLPLPLAPANVHQLVYHDHGEGPVLYASLASNPPRIVRLRAGIWEELPPGLSSTSLLSIAAFDDGGGEALFAVGGSGTNAIDGTGWVFTPVARFRHDTWTAVTEDLRPLFHDILYSSLAVVDDRLYISGSFKHLGHTRADHFGWVQACPRTCTPDFDGDGAPATDADIEAFFLCLAGTCCPRCTADFNADGDIGTDADIEAFFRVLAGGNC